MKKIFRSLGLLGLAGAAVLTASSCSVFGETYYYKYDSETKGYAITGLKNYTDNSLEIPSKHNGKKVTKIADEAFQGWNTITKVKLPSSIKVIGNNAFDGCESIKSFNIPNKTVEIGDEAFANCKSLETVNIPESLIYLGDYVFSNCPSLDIGSDEGDAVYFSGILVELTESGKAKDTIEVESGTKCINSGVFMNNTNIKTVVLPDTIKTICADAFNGATNLTSVNIPQGVVQIGDNAFKNYQNVEAINLTSTDEVKIKESAFYGCQNLKTVEVAGDLSVDYQAFVGSGVTTLTVAGGVDFVDPEPIVTATETVERDNLAFQNVTSLKTVSVGGEALIGKNTFEGCTGLDTLNIDNFVQIKKNAFVGCSSLTSIELPETLEFLGNGAFRNCKGLTSAKINESGVKTIGDGNSEDKKDYGVFEGCTSLVSVELNDGITAINYRSFSGCSSLTTVTGISNVEVFAGYAFNNCKALTTFSISDKVALLGERAFGGCSELTTFIYGGTVNEWKKVSRSEKAFSGSSKLTVITCSDGEGNLVEGK